MVIKSNVAGIALCSTVLTMICLTYFKLNFEEEQQTVRSKSITIGPDLALPSLPQFSLEELMPIQTQHQHQHQHQHQQTKNEIELPFVTIMSLSAGQREFDRNILMNALYQSYPHHLLELIVVESSQEPSQLLSQWNNTIRDETSRAEHDWPNFEYYHFQTDTVPTGTKRNLILNLSRGDIVIHADNDDIISSQYVHAVVNQFMLTDGNHPGTKCCHDGRDGPLLRDMMYLAPHAHSSFNPDGSVFFNPRPGYNVGALMSYSRMIAKNCRFKTRNVQEEGNFLREMKEMLQEPPVVHGTIKEFGGYMLIIRCGSPLQTSSVAYYNARERWSQLTTDEFIDLFKVIEGWYITMHEASRPFRIPPLPGDELAKVSDGAARWKRFWEKHPELFSGGKAPYCGTFVATPSVIYATWRTNFLEKKVDSKSADECCRTCDSYKDGDKTCVGWTQYFKNQTCHMWIEDLNTMDKGGFLDVRTPTIKHATWREFASAVRPEVCPKCGSGTNFWKKQ